MPFAFPLAHLIRSSHRCFPRLNPRSRVGARASSRHSTRPRTSTIADLTQQEPRRPQRSRGWARWGGLTRRFAAAEAAVHDARHAGFALVAGWRAAARGVSNLLDGCGEERPQQLGRGLEKGDDRATQLSPAVLALLKYRDLKTRNLRRRPRRKPKKHNDASRCDRHENHTPFAMSCGFTKLTGSVIIDISSRCRNSSIV